MEEYETGYDLEEEASDQEEESYQEEPEADPEEETGEEQLEADESEENLEEESVDQDSEENLEEDPETVSGNDIVISGDVVVFPEGFDPGSEQLDAESIVQAIEEHNENITAGLVCVCFLLGVLVGAIIITGLRLRRV